MNSPDSKFKFVFDSMYAYPPQIEPVFFEMTSRLSEYVERTGVLAETPFRRGIFVTFIPGPREDEKLRRLKLDTQNSCLWVSLRVSGDELWDYAEKDDMEFVVKRILTKIVGAVCLKYRLDSKKILPW